MNLVKSWMIFIHTILLSLPCSSIWDIVKQNLLDKGIALNLDIVTAELLFVHDCTERKQHLEQTETKQKTDWLTLFVKPFV